MRPEFRSRWYPPLPVLGRLSNSGDFLNNVARHSAGFSFYLSLDFAQLSMLFHLILLTMCEHVVRRFFELPVGDVVYLGHVASSSISYNSAASHHPQFGVVVSAPDGVMNVFHTRNSNISGAFGESRADFLELGTSTLGAGAT